MPAGLGEPVFDRLEADLAKAMLSLPATKGFEIGSGFAGTLLKGSEHNDAFERRGGRVRTRTNLSGGVQGGISNGEEIFFRVAFKPTATILRPQATVDVAGRATELQARGRHDPCVLPRAVPDRRGDGGARARRPLAAPARAEPNVRVLTPDSSHRRTRRKRRCWPRKALCWPTECLFVAKKNPRQSV